VCRSGPWAAYFAGLGSRRGQADCGRHFNSRGVVPLFTALKLAEYRLLLKTVAGRIERSSVELLLAFQDRVT